MAKQDPLKEYRKKRDFEKSPEPSGKKQKKSRKPLFVIQKHEASRLHYDFRLEVDGVLKSWAIPKGPSPDPKEKRLAVMTENHPRGYADFEGVIPKGEYGAGTVMVWDIGTYKNLRADKEKGPKTMQESIEDGMVEVWLEGEKLKGGYVLIRTKFRGRESWLFKKMKDAQADARKNPVSSKPKSALSGRTMNQIRKQQKAADG